MLSNEDVQLRLLDPSVSRILNRHGRRKERLLGPEHPEVGTTLNNLAVVCRRRGLLEEAEALYRRAIDILSETVEPSHPALAASRGNLSKMLNDRKAARPDALSGEVSPADRRPSGGNRVGCLSGHRR